MWIISSTLAALALFTVVFTNMPHFGKTPRGERLERVRSSENYRDGKFQNIHETKQLTSDKSFVAMIWQFLFKKKERMAPTTDLPSMNTNLWELDRNENVLVWFGHSSYMIQMDGKRILVDPTLSGAASPVSFFNKPFKGTSVYKPEDIPDIDYLIISHDHWDHLDYKTVKRLKDRVGKVVCGLGVGEHFERWGFKKEDIIELDWDESSTLDGSFTIHCLPARHFSGRGFSPNQSLWASFLIESRSRKIYIGGDGGYDTHYAEIGERFEGIDIAILENGQYDEGWRYIHLLPEQIVQAFADLKAKRLFTVHHSKFALANHPWDEPLKKISEFTEKDSINLMQPMIGEIVNLDDSTYVTKKWWETAD
jgi:Predicted Zn-dependent hydrolases of the beta-lactamase fold